MQPKPIGGQGVVRDPQTLPSGVWPHRADKALVSSLEMHTPSPADNLDVVPHQLGSLVYEPVHPLVGQVMRHGPQDVPLRLSFCM